MTPIVDGKTLTFEAGGLYDGLVVLRDLETGSYWNHITGECMTGVHEGKVLATSNLYHYTFEKAIDDYPDLQVAISKVPFPFSIFAFVSDKLLRGKNGFIPPHFRKTIAKEDDRLNEHTLGLGVIIGDKAKFYDVDRLMKAGSLEDTFAGENISINYDEETSTPRCTFKDSKKAPLQLFTRWYGFSLTFKNCDIYE